MINSTFYDMEGKPLDIKDHKKIKELQANKVIKQEVLKNGNFLSTVWIGIDMSFDGGKPLIFETMLFKSKKDFQDLDCQRYATLEEAEAGHITMKRKINELYENLTKTGRY